MTAHIRGHGRAPRAIVDLEARGKWFNKAIDVAPALPVWFLFVVAGILATPGLGADALLSLADALDETGRAVGLNGDPMTRAHLLRLSDLPRDLAPERARKED